MFTKEIIKKLIIIVIITISTYSFILLYRPKGAWLWTFFLVIGLLMLLMFSPEHKVVKGIRSIELIYWPFLLVVPVFFVISLARTQINIEARFIMGLCFLIFECGMEVFWNRVFRKRKKENSKA
jgi:hypothetical protein